MKKPNSLLIKTHRIFLVLVVIGLASLQLHAQDKNALSVDDLPDWKQLSSTRLSNNGEWVSYEINPYVGDGTLHLLQPDQGFEKIFERGYRAVFSPQNNYIAFMIKPFQDTINTLKIKKTPKSKMPKDTLAIYVFEADTLLKFPGVKSFKMADKGMDWIVFQYEKPKPKEEIEPDSKSKKKKKKKKREKPTNETKKKPKKFKVSDIEVFQPTTLRSVSVPDVDTYVLSEFGNSLAYTRFWGDSIDTSGVYWLHLKTMKTDTAYFGVGKSIKPTFNYRGNELVFLHSSDTGKTKSYALYFTAGNSGTRIIIDTNDRNLPKGWTPSEYARPYFSRDNSKIYFGTAPRPKEIPDDTLSEDRKPHLDVWSWQDKEPQPLQLKRMKREKERIYLAVFHVNRQAMVQLADSSMKHVQTLQKGNGDVGLGFVDDPYSLSYSWRFPWPSDYYLIDFNTGEKKLLLEEQGYPAQLSNTGKYLLYFDGEKGNWLCRDITSDSIANITAQLSAKGVLFSDPEQEIPAAPYPFGVTGWSENDQRVIIRSQYDLWVLDPTGKAAPVPISGGTAAAEHLRLRYFRSDRDESFIKLDSVMLLYAQNMADNQAGLFVRYPNAERFQPLIMDDIIIHSLQKAQHNNRFIFRMENFILAPDVYLTDQGTNQLERIFSSYKKLSNMQAQQEPYNWGFSREYFWKDKDGVERKGLLFLPEIFNPGKKYPLMIYFYEKNFNTENMRRAFRPSRSTISVPLYTSNDYIVFIPDITYGTGHPGNDGTNAVVSGAKALVSEGFIDSTKMAIQGQSWGGYQVAYMVTQTNIFAAAMAGAPVSNMTSAYGGIRWGSGHSREFQYERTQSRIGKNLWEATDLYLENSPVFHLPKVTTPLLIMHNDNDGAVPWYQGIEMFMGLRRLGKPAWMLVYNNEEHNLRKMPNRLDLSRRMFQFFNHYLKGDPSPEWMKDGIPAVKKGEKYGY